jgi:hypothetical protein
MLGSLQKQPLAVEKNSERCQIVRVVAARKKGPPGQFPVAAAASFPARVVFFTEMT